MGGARRERVGGGRSRRGRAREWADTAGAPRRGLGADRMIVALVIALVFVAVAALVLGGMAVRVLRESERAVVFRLGRVTEPWGVKVTTVEIKDVEIPDRMQHAIARQAEAERERRAKVINAEGEFQAAARLNDAADVISRNPVTIQLRYLQTLMEVSGNQSSTIVFPLPVDVLQPLVSAAQNRQVAAERQDRAQLD